MTNKVVILVFPFTHEFGMKISKGGNRDMIPDSDLFNLPLYPANESVTREVFNDVSLSSSNRWCLFPG